jgi:hypothetical protein
MGFFISAECPLLADRRHCGFGNHVYSSGCFRPKAVIPLTYRNAALFYNKSKCYKTILILGFQKLGVSQNGIEKFIKSFGLAAFVLCRFNRTYARATVRVRSSASSSMG